MDILIRIASDSSTGHYPEAVLEDEIYRTKENGRKCAELGIRLNSPKSGGKQVNQEKTERKIAQMDSRKQNAVEGNFGARKRFYKMDCIKGKTEYICKVMIALYFIIPDLAKRLRDFLSQFLNWILILSKRNDFINYGRQNRIIPQLA